MSNITDLFPALVECFVIILFGYASGRLGIITPSQGRGIGNFVGTFALPALLFKNMVELNFKTVSWGLMVAVFLGKTIVFVIVLVFSVILVRPRGIGRGSLYAIFTTQSNDFALGYPLVQALYHRTHPEFLQYIYLLAPISLLILNPIGFLLLEIDKVRNKTTESSEVTNEEGNTNIAISRDGELDTDVSSGIGSSDANHEAPNNASFTKWTCWGIFKGVILNPLVFMVFIGLIGHFVFHGKLPRILHDSLATLANAFSATALFYLGLTMVGKIAQQRGIGLLIPASLIAAKILLLPILIRELVIALSDIIPVYHPHSMSQNSTNVTEYIYKLADFGYLYGTFPTAPTVVIYAAKYGIEMDRLATGMVFCTSLSAPIMYISAWTLGMSRMSLDFFQKEVEEVDKDISIISLVCSAWCIGIFVIGRKFLNVPHAITLSYIVALLFSSLGSILLDRSGFETTTEGAKLFVFGMMFFGVQSARMMTASLAISLAAAIKLGQRWVWRQIGLFTCMPFIFAFLTTVLLMSSSKYETKPTFQYGHAQNITSFVVVLMSLIITVICLIIILKAQYSGGTGGSPGIRYSETQCLLDRTDISLDSTSTDEEGSDNFEMPRQRNCCNFIQIRYSFTSMQVGRHIVLLLLLVLSMSIGLCLIGWKMTNMLQAGIFFEISFLDSVFNFGQGFLAFCVFGLDEVLVIEPFLRMWRKLWYGFEDISLPPLSSVEREALLRCLQFTRYHMEECKLDIVGEHKSGLTTYREVFTGKDLCTWLVDRGLVSDRLEACIYGQHLMLGHVLYHHKSKYYFHDQNYLYKFEEPKTCQESQELNRNRGDGGSPHLTPGTSRMLKASPRKLPNSSPAKMSFHGFSFEAYLISSDTESHFSPRRTLVGAPSPKPGVIVPSANNNCNFSDSSLNGLADPPVPRKKKSRSRSKKSNSGKTTENTSDSSY